jgi:tRNA dimethylallyltransferase
VVGPTASGKTELALRLARELDGEIVNADSVQVYQKFEIGTGKPSALERAQAPHHLLDIRDPLEPLDAAKWAELADGAIASIRARGKVPIVCGGTFLWVKALIYGLAEAPPADAEIRARHRGLAEERGRPALHEQLKAIDPTTAERLAPNDFVRVSRALEVYELTGIPLSLHHAEHGFRQARYDVQLVGPRRERPELDDRIRARAQAMLDAGWVDEVKRLIELGYAESRAMRSVGYKQIFDFVSGSDLGGKTLLEAIVQVTRIFARRQRTWLREQPIDWRDS